MRRPGARTLALGLGWSLALGAACTSSDKGAQKSAPAKAAETPAAAKAGEAVAAAAADADAGTVEMERVVISPAEPPKVELIEAGAEPRVQLRFDPPVGEKRKMHMTMSMSVGMQMGAQAMPAIKTPPVRTSGVIEVTKKEGGLITGELAFGQLDVLDAEGIDPAIVAATRQQLSAFTGMTSVTVVDDSGAVKEGYMEFPKGLPANAQQSMRSMGQSAGQMTVPMPREAVGVGAKWSATTTVENVGMKLQQTANYTLEKIEGSRVFLSIELTQSVPPGPFVPPGMPPGTTVDVKKMDSTGKGRVEVDMKAPMPDLMNMALQSHMEMEIEASGQSQTMGLDMEMSLELGTDSVDAATP